MEGAKGRQMTIREPSVAVVKAGLNGDTEEEHDDFDGDRTIRREGQSIGSCVIRWRTSR